MELARGVHLIPTYAQCALLTDDRLVLVDTGAEGDAKEILSYFEGNGIRTKDIATIAITHTHPDHVGGLATLHRATEARVAAHVLEAPFIAREATYPGPPGPQRHRPVPVDVRLEDGQRWEGFTVVHTPGHTPGSMCLLDTERQVLIAGDALRNEDGLGPMDDRYNIDPAEHRASIRKLAALDFEVLVMGHGPPLQERAAEAVRALAARL